MRSLFGTIFLSASGLFALLTSWTSFRYPAGFAKRLGLMVQGADGLNEIRAQYGGFFLAVAAIDALVLLKLLDRRLGYVINAAVFGGLIFGRLSSLAIDRGFQNYSGSISALFFIDAFGLLLAVASLVLDRRGDGESGVRQEGRIEPAFRGARDL
jgi:hypothetical protein